MEKMRIKRPMVHVKMKDSKVPGYPPDIRYKLLANLCKSNTINSLSNNIDNLTRIVKTQKPLTLKFGK
jgi:hypothetical protein